MLDPARDAYRLLVPEWLRRAVLVRRRARQWTRAGILFIHIPKAAGTSINNVLYGRLMGHIRASDIRRWGNEALTALPSFAVTRNPWDRLLSAYRFAIQGRGIGVNAGGVWRPEQYRRPEFETFERFVVEWLSRRDPSKLDFIFQPQHLFVTDRGGKILVEHVGRVENLDATAEYVSSRLGRSVFFPRYNRSGSQTDYRRFYTPETSEIVRTIYRKDVDLFGYDFDREP